MPYNIFFNVNRDTKEDIKHLKSTVCLIQEPATVSGTIAEALAAHVSCLT